ncbi:MAG: ATP-binding protein [Anaerolineae bacterium]|nr:ATP-binding protein [Anaerolineae bacterium]
MTPPRAGVLPGDGSAVMGFRIPALPVARETTLAPQQQLAQLLRRFVVFARALHVPQPRRAIALHVVAHPERSILGAEVGVYLLCRVTHPNFSEGLDAAAHLAQQVYQLFPTESLFNYDMPTPLTRDELQQATFQTFSVGSVEALELRKYEEETLIYSLESLDAQAQKGYIFHPFWADTQLDPWLNLIESLSRLETPTVISIALEPTALLALPGIADRVEKLRMIADYGEQRRSLFFQNVQTQGDGAQERSISQVLALVRVARALGLNDFDVARAQRGAYAYQQLLAGQDQLFKMRVTLAANGQVDSALVQAVRAALCFPAADAPDGALGWTRPDALTPVGESQRAAALHNLHWLDHQDWGSSQEIPELRHLRHLVTAQEAVGLFHLPLMPQAGQTSALSTADVPFVIPPEVISTARYRKKATSAELSTFDPDWFEVVTERRPSSDGMPTVRFGYLYQRNQYLGPTSPEKDGTPFELRVTDLKRPSLLVGAPGSGKSNLALYLLIQLWRDHQTPFLVLDPSTGHEYRYLYAAESLKNDLVVYTVGDNETFPLRFNPFAVPPGVTVRAHITRLLACFKAAYEMWDPLPAIYEAALARVYKDKRFGWHMDEKWGGAQALQPCHHFPCLADFAQAIEDEIEENVKPNYGRSEAGSALTGASQIRINGVLNSVGHVINVRQNDVTFFQNLLSKPVVVELGALGDPGTLALVMAFLITQLAGYIEYAAPPGEKREKRQHLLLIDEAHRLLSGEATGGGAHQGNVRGKSAEELNTLLAEVRKFGQGIMVLDQRPSSLVGGVLDNALINIMCRLHDREGFEHLSHVLNLNPKQQRYAHTSLKPGDALMLDTQSGQPVLLRPPNVVDALSRRHNLPEELALMQRNAARMGLKTPGALPQPEKKAPPAGQAEATSRVLTAEERWAITHKIAASVMQAPFRTCVYCRPLQEKGECPHRKAIHQLIQHDTTFHQSQLDALHAALRIAEREPRWKALTQIGQKVATLVAPDAQETSSALAYCYFAHIASDLFGVISTYTPAQQQARREYRFLLFEFATHYDR